MTPATPEAGAGGSLETRNSRLQWARITSLHFSLEDSQTLSLKIKISKQKINTCTGTQGEMCNDFHYDIDFIVENMENNKVNKENTWY